MRTGGDMRGKIWLWGMALALMATAAYADDVTYTYDALGRLKTATYVDGGVTYNIAYSYDAAGNRTQVVNGGAVNTNPVAVADSISVAQNSTITFNPRTNDSDADGDALTISAKTNGVHGAVLNNGGASLTYTPTTGYNGSDTFTYTVYDGRGGYGTVNVSVTVTAVNQAPDALNDARTTEYNTALTFDPRTNDTDPESNALTVTAVTNGAHGTASVGGGGASVTYTPTTGYSGSDTFTYTISDGQGGTDTATVTMTVRTQNVAPTAVADSNSAFALYTGGAGVRPTKTFDPRTNDSDSNGDPLTITGVTQGTKGAVTFTGTTVTYTYGTSTSTQLSTTDTFTYTISDGRGGTGTATVTMTITVETNQ